MNSSSLKFLRPYNYNPVFKSIVTIYMYIYQVLYIPYMIQIYYTVYTSEDFSAKLVVVSYTLVFFHSSI